MFPGTLPAVVSEIGVPSGEGSVLSSWDVAALCANAAPFAAINRNGGAIEKPAAQMIARWIVQVLAKIGKVKAVSISF